jgi:hypothetical protein
LGSYSSFRLTEWHWNYYFTRKEVRVKDQHGEHTTLSGYEPKCAFCQNALAIGDKIRMRDYPFIFWHFDCWRKKTAQEKARFEQLREEHRRERQERREELRLSNHDPPGSFRLSTNFLQSFGSMHGFLMTCAVCGIQFHPGSLVSAVNLNGNRRLIHYQCKNA